MPNSRLGAGDMSDGLKPYSDFARLRKAVERSLKHVSPFSGTLYRACDPTYANTRDLLSGEGSRRFGGRWNAPGSFAVVYLARTIEGAMTESMGVVSHFGFDPADRLPLTLVSVDASLEHVLDLTAPGVRKLLGITISQMSAGDWRGENSRGYESMTQALGRACFELSCQGIAVPSAANRKAKNVNLFPAHLIRVRSLEIRRADRLPPPKGT